MFSVRLMQEGDYELMSPWFVFWKFAQPPKDCLPENGLGGLMVCKCEIPVVGGYIYFTNSKICWVEWICRNNEYREKDAKEAILILLDELANIAKSKGFKVIFTSVKHPSLINHYKEAGWVIGSEGTKEMIIKL